MRSAFAALLLAGLMPGLASSQVIYTNGQRVARSRQPIVTGGHKGLVVTFHGALKQITKKAILIQFDGNKILWLRRSSKTKFIATGREIQGYEIDLETPVTIDASEDNDLKFLALKVKIDPPGNFATPK